MIGRGERAANYVILVAFAIFALYPIGKIVAIALGPADSGSGGGILGVHPGNFVDAWQTGHFGSYLRTSLLVSVIVVVVSVLCSILAGYALGMLRFRGADALFYLFLIGMMMPNEVIVVPLYYDLRSVHLTDTIWAVVLPQIAQSIAFGTYWMRAYFRAGNRSMVEAARLDGANSWRTLWSVLVPLGRPAIVTLTLLVFMWTWNEFLIPLVMVTKDSLQTAPLGLAFFQGQHTSATTLLAAAACLVATPIVVLYAFLQRHFIAGMLEGAVRE
ncbi:carbohydrate ABC transporter permease [Calidifontibacter sp. DB0510]|uniref:Carbohydrate ABC transporter permease n=1 Tax=Metallococcus carri TaxID=1656884 RepID=A0A967AZV9_9MICO|nr:carbohydrate ABC transporter permease [Metallococcus carri]NHN54670.1 carbohydrate ABC transporter permease [Metallococcus carri]NOP37015.1 carbohydrate ABC transporter permease [Calidifontibacter sp. DB2511S]